MTTPKPCYVQFHSLTEFLEELAAEKDSLVGPLRVTRATKTGSFQINYVSMIATARSFNTIYRLDAQVGDLHIGDTERADKIEERWKSMFEKANTWAHKQGISCRAGVYTWDGVISPETKKAAG